MRSNESWWHLFASCPIPYRSLSITNSANRVLSRAKSAGRRVPQVTRARRRIDRLIAKIVDDAADLSSNRRNGVNPTTRTVNGDPVPDQYYNPVTATASRGNRSALLLLSSRLIRNILSLSLSFSSLLIFFISFLSRSKRRRGSALATVRRRKETTTETHCQRRKRQETRQQERRREGGRERWIG